MGALSDKFPIGSLALFIILSVVVGLLSRLALFSIIAQSDQIDNIVTAYKKGLGLLMPFCWVSGLVIIALVGGYVLLIIPGILLSSLLSMSLYAYLVENRRGMSALAASWHYVKGHWWGVSWRLLFFGMVLFLTNLIIAFATNGPAILQALRGAASTQSSFLSQMLGAFYSNFIAFPLGIIYPYGLYLSLKTMKPVFPESEEHRIKRTITIFSIIGFLTMIIIPVVFTVFIVTKFIPHQAALSPSAQQTPIEGVQQSQPAEQRQVMLSQPSQVISPQSSQNDMERKSNIQAVATALSLYTEKQTPHAAAPVLSTCPTGWLVSEQNGIGCPDLNYGSPPFSSFLNSLPTDSEAQKYMYRNWKNSTAYCLGVRLDSGSLFACNSHSCQEVANTWNALDCPVN